ncbi:hypothetical protein ABZP36_032089 [Zizania latifolia]
MSLALLLGPSAEEGAPATAAELSDSGDSSGEDAGSDGEEVSDSLRLAAKPRRRPNPSPAGMLAAMWTPHRCPPRWQAAAYCHYTLDVVDMLDHKICGAVVVAKPQLAAIRERVSSDTNGANSPGYAEGKRIIGVTNPGSEDAADLLRTCLQCGIPKTYSHARGMICPVCNDRPQQTKEPEKKKGSTVKDKEKAKRMRGQSSHATWKSETEMALRQQFD